MAFTKEVKKAGYYAGGKQIEREMVSATCWSGDTKETGFADGSSCLEINRSTGEMKLYFYDQTSEAWVEGA